MSCMKNNILEYFGRSAHPIIPSPLDPRLYERLTKFTVEVNLTNIHTYTRIVYQHVSMRNENKIIF